MSKDDIKIFTGSGTFKVEKPQSKTDKPQYISATGGDESIVHDKCGTPECCQKCESAPEPISAYSHVKRKTH